MRAVAGFLWMVLFASAASPAEFQRAVEPRAFRFPQDHASHAGFQTEWWYVTGNVKGTDGRDFGYQFTLFRRAADPAGAQERGRSSSWAMSDFYVGHAAISDIQAGAFHCDETYARGAAGIAGATEAAAVKDGASPLRVWLHDWEIARQGGVGGEAARWTVKARFGAHALDLTLTETKPVFLNGKAGEEGLSRKGPQPGQASYYYSLPGLATRGTLTVNGTAHAVESGTSWLDREWGSNQLSKNQAGWDWFALQFDDGGALMLYILRNTDGSVEPASSGTYVAPDGARTHLALAEVQLKRGRTWTSPHSNGVYTLGWELSVPKLGLALFIDAAQDDQEIRSARFSKIFYYEGSVHARGTRAGKATRGVGYLEITGAPGQTGATRGLGGVL